jgi:predicted NBD/HSP70 family sugar kinase
MGRALAGVVTWFNPRRVVIGGNALAESSLFQSAVGRTLHTHTLAASVQHLELRYSTRERPEEIAGASAMVVEVLLSADYMAEWAPGGFPIDVEVLLAKHTDLLA